MVILLPREGTFEAFEAHLSIERLDAILAQLCSKRVVLAMPRFELTSEFSLVETLAEEGNLLALQGKQCQNANHIGGH